MTNFSSDHMTRIHDSDWLRSWLVITLPCEYTLHQLYYIYSWAARSKIWKSTGSEKYRSFDA